MSVDEFSIGENYIVERSDSEVQNLDGSTMLFWSGHDDAELLSWFRKSSTIDTRHPGNILRVVHFPTEGIVENCYIIVFMIGGLEHDNANL